MGKVVDLRKIEKPTGACLKRRAKALKANSTRAEQIMEYRLIEMGIKYRSQVVIGWYIADILIPNKLLVIELDGSSHNSKDIADAKRTFWLKQFGFEVLRVPNEYAEDFDLSMIDGLPDHTDYEAAKAIQAAKKSRNRALYYKPEQQNRYKSNSNKTKVKLEEWQKMPEVDDRGKLVRSSYLKKY